MIKNDYTYTKHKKIKKKTKLLFLFEIFQKKGRLITLHIGIANESSYCGLKLLFFLSFMLRLFFFKLENYKA